MCTSFCVVFPCLWKEHLPRLLNIPQPMISTGFPGVPWEDSRNLTLAMRGPLSPAPRIWLGSWARGLSRSGRTYLEVLVTSCSSLPPRSWHPFSVVWAAPACGDITSAGKEVPGLVASAGEMPADVALRGHCSQMAPLSLAVGDSPR